MRRHLWGAQGAEPEPRPSGADGGSPGLAAGPQVAAGGQRQGREAAGAAWPCPQPRERGRPPAPPQPLRTERERPRGSLAPGGAARGPRERGAR